MFVTAAARSPGPAGRQPEPATRVTVGTDGSYWGDMALTWAAQHAAATNAELRVLRLAAPDPVPGLLAASAGSRLLVLGCRGDEHRAFGLGNHVLPVAGSAPCDTLVVRGLWPAITMRHRRITAMVSGGDHDRSVLRAAAELATAHDAELRVYGRPRSDALADAKAWCDRETTGVRISLHPDLQSAHDIVLGATDSDLLVLGRGAPSRCGTVARFALHHAPCPVLVAGPSTRGGQVERSSRGARFPCPRSPSPQSHG